VSSLVCCCDHNISTEWHLPQLDTHFARTRAQALPGVATVSVGLSCIRGCEGKQQGANDTLCYKIL